MSAGRDGCCSMAADCFVLGVLKMENLEVCARKIISGLGGQENIKVCDSCITRLRMQVDAIGLIKEDELKEAGVREVVCNGPEDVQLVMGTVAPEVAAALKIMLKATSRDNRITSAQAASARKILNALGGSANIASFDNCITRLRPVVKDTSAVNEQALLEAGVREVVFEEDNKNSLQLVLGVTAPAVADEIRILIDAENGKVDSDTAVAQKLLPGLGGHDNIVECTHCSTRVRVVVKEPKDVDVNALLEAGVREVVYESDSSENTPLQLVIGLKAPDIGDALETLLH